MTNEELEFLNKWDSNLPVWTCEMAGLGPAYEQCIQLMAIEMFRAMVKNPPDSWDALKANEADWLKYCDKIEKLPEFKPIVTHLQPSGMQFEAAVDLATKWARDGYDPSLIPEDRRIQVTKYFPNLPLS